MKKPNEYLNMTVQDYNDYKIELYMRWCLNISSKTGSSFQKNLANTAISNYFYTQFRENEHTFISAASKIEGVLDYNFMRQMLGTIMSDLFRTYPSALIEAAKNLKIENQISLN